MSEPYQVDAFSSEIEIDSEDMLFETEDYCVLITKIPDPQFSSGNVERWVYAVVNKLSGIQEQYLNNMPAAFNWCMALQDALDAVEEEVMKKVTEQDSNQQAGQVH